MKSAITFFMDDEIKRRLKVYSAQTGRTVTDILTGYISNLVDRDSKSKTGALNNGK